MRYSDELIEEVRSRSNIVDLVSNYVKLERRGSSYVGLCPFHNEKTPSFSVSPGRQMYHCFGCGAGGNAITFLMEYENYSFLEAVQYLAKDAGIDLPQIEYSKEAKKDADLKSQLLEVNKEAAKFYYVKLRSPSGQIGLQYLSGRGLSEETMKRFGLGFSDKYNHELYQFLKNKGYADALLKESGLFNVDEKRGMYDKFWNRVIFPIMDVNSKVIGFGGRVMGDAKPKYLNSPETKVFDKSRTLYGLHVARSARKKNLIICEGYMDVIAMHQAGFNNAVASLGTALTSQQASLLKRYTDEVLIIYDSDVAGVKAALRAIPMLRSVGLNTKVVNLEPHKDPDEFISHEGMGAFQKRLEEAENSFLFEIKTVQKNYNIRDPQEKADFFHEVVERLFAFEDEFERASYTESICRLYGVPLESMKKAIAKRAMKGSANKHVNKEFSVDEVKVQKKTKKESGNGEAQKLMLTWISSSPRIIDDLSSYLSPEDFTTPFYREVADMVFAQHRMGAVNAAEIINHFEDCDNQREAASLFHASLVLQEEKDKKRALLDVLCSMKTKSIETRIKSINPADLEGLKGLMEEKKQLEKLKREGFPFDIQF